MNTESMNRYLQYMVKQNHKNLQLGGLPITASIHTTLHPTLIRLWKKQKNDNLVLMPKIRID